jgi:hypothetical protein
MVVYAVSTAYHGSSSNDVVITRASPLPVSPPKANSSRRRQPETIKEVTDGESAIQQELKDIHGAMLETGPRTLPILCEKLGSDERRIRHSALTNLVVLADREALPALTNAMNRVIDADERAEIEKAIEFLQLPTYDELVANGALPPPGKSPMTSNRLEAETIHVVTNAQIQKVQN